MKNIRTKFLALLLITSVAFLSCKKEDHFSPSSANNTTASKRFKPTINYADWSITLFQTNKANETVRFNRYTFKFAHDGILKASSNGTSENGYYLTGQRPNPENFVIVFDSDLLGTLNREWHIVNRTSDDLQLEFINEIGRKEYLTFQRIRPEALPGNTE